MSATGGVSDDGTGTRRADARNRSPPRSGRWLNCRAELKLTRPRRGSRNRWRAARLCRRPSAGRRDRRPGRERPVRYRRRHLRSRSVQPYQQSSSIGAGAPRAGTHRELRRGAIRGSMLSGSGLIWEHLSCAVMRLQTWGDRASGDLITRRSRVRIPPPLLRKARKSGPFGVKGPVRKERRGANLVHFGPVCWCRPARGQLRLHEHTFLARGCRGDARSAEVLGLRASRQGRIPTVALGRYRRFRPEAIESLDRAARGRPAPPRRLSDRPGCGELS